MKTILESINTISIIQNAIKISISRLLCVGYINGINNVICWWKAERSNINRKRLDQIYLATDFIPALPFFKLCDFVQCIYCSFTPHLLTGVNNAYLLRFREALNRHSVNAHLFFLPLNLHIDLDSGRLS